MSAGALPDAAAIEALVPHAGAMSLWDEVVGWDAEWIQLRTWRHRDPAHPLRADGRLHAVHLCEYGAQAMAVHGGLRARAAEADARPGLLVGLSGIELCIDRIDRLPGALECEAHLLMDSPAGCQYRFALHHAGTRLAEGRATVMPG
ncbi:phosphotransferase [Lysobacter sp. GX 14042]|uniref:phosphotransferase n=1 Tax=Lysobacter sp. GX 14042 TaxID=2907155 RepID=UPI001F40259B|nr:phosphotransferase [Lysobacter sp. GX 14042]MCE7032144.1 phosphotransferase [Lysobacter sp. GX 14042]